MRPEDFRPDDLFGQIQSLVDALAAEREGRAAAEAADKAKTELLAMVGQELRKPMQAIVAMAELLLASPLDPTQQRYTKTLAQSARSLIAVLNDVLDFSKLETGRLKLGSAPFDLYELVQELAALLQARASEKQLTSGVDIGASCPRFIKGDPARLRQILTSLIDSALKFTREGSVRLHASAQETEGRLTLRFDVSDTGTGLSKSEREFLFRPSVQPDGAVASGPASGLSLAIAQRLAGLMGGEIGLDSAVGQGSLYWFTLPAERAHMDVAGGGRGKDAPPQGTLSGHVLVVEDNAVNRMLIGAYLDEFGLSYEMVDQGSAAIMALAAKSYDLVLLDMAMPDLDGVETAKRIRSLHADARKVPIVALAAYAGKGEGDGDYRAAGVDAAVAKPIRGRELYAALAPFLSPDETKPTLKVVKG